MDRSSFMGKLGLVVILSLIGLIVISSAAIRIEAGTVGVVLQFGRVTGRVLDPGLNWKIPFVDSIETYNTKDVVYETSPEFKQLDSQADYKSFPVDTTTEDGQSVDLSYSIRFRVDRASAPKIAQELGDEAAVVEKVVKFHSRILCRQVPRSYEASELYTGDVSVVEMDIVSQLEPLFLEKGLILDSFGIREIAFSEDYIEAIEQKQIEKERVITEQYKAEQAKFKKEASITEAEGEAESIRIKGQALAQNPDMVQLEFVRSLRDPESKVQVMVIPMEGVLPLLSLPDMGVGLGGN
jgi:regulator of protease activity HflC (stomatin/prohibitin superfamily)